MRGNLKNIDISDLLILIGLLIVGYGLYIIYSPLTILLVGIVVAVFGYFIGKATNGADSGSIK